jgi:hypothetical protein
MWQECDKCWISQERKASFLRGKNYYGALFRKRIKANVSELRFRKMCVGALRLKPESGSQATVWPTCPSSRPLINILCFQRGSSAHLIGWGGYIVRENVCLCVVSCSNFGTLLVVVVSVVTYCVLYYIAYYYIDIAVNVALHAGVMLVESGI